MKRKAFIPICMTCLVLFILMVVGGSVAIAQEKTGGQFYTLEESLKDLKKQARATMERNRILFKKIDKLRDRLPELQGRIEDLQKEQKDIVQENNRFKKIYQNERNETQQVEQKVKRLEIELERLEADEAEEENELEAKREIKERLIQEVSDLRRQVQDAKFALEDQKDFVPDPYAQQKENLRQSLKAIKKEIISKRAELDQLEKMMVAPQKKFQKVREEHRSLSAKVQKHEKEIEGLLKERDDMNVAMDSFRAKEQARLNEIGAEINDREIYIEDLKQTINDGQETQQILKKQFGPQRASFLRTINDLKKENLVLAKQFEALQSMRTLQQGLLDELKQTQQIKGERESLKGQVADFKETRSSLEERIALKKEEQKQTEAKVADLKRDIAKLKKEIRVQKRRVVRKKAAPRPKGNRAVRQAQKELEREERNLASAQKKILAPQKKLEGLKKTSLELRKEISRLIGDLRVLEKEAKRAKEQKLMQVGREGQYFERITDKIKELELYEKELENLLEVVQKKKKESQSNIGLLRKEKNNLSDHLRSLEAENKQLQEDVLILMMTRDRMLE